MVEGSFGIPGFGVARFIVKALEGDKPMKLTPRMIGVRYWERYWRWCEDLEEHGENVGHFT